MGLRIKRSIVPVVLVASLTILLRPSDQPLAQPVIFDIPKGADFCDVCPLLWDGTWVCD